MLFSLTFCRMRNIIGKIKNNKTKIVCRFCSSTLDHVIDKQENIIIKIKR